MVLKIFLIVLFLSSLPSFATDTPFISEEDTDINHYRLEAGSLGHACKAD